ncbi:hypothetical protein XENORESO_017496 [Xenotaenia resolanae]|uniref:Uncharacterized protein n=1 Tax=Xenotaenia resolanae TaxID=208358 RepID=A0ABV0VYW4_9TELE
MVDYGDFSEFNVTSLPQHGLGKVEVDSTHGPQSRSLCCKYDPQGMPPQTPRTPEVHSSSHLQIFHVSHLILQNEYWRLGLGHFSGSSSSDPISSAAAAPK